MLERCARTTPDRSGPERAERRSGVDRRSGRDRRGVDLWRQVGRGFDLRSGQDRRSRGDRRGSRSDVEPDPAGRPPPDIVTPWQIGDGYWSAAPPGP